MRLSRSWYLVVLAMVLGGCCCQEAPRRAAPTVRAKAPRSVPIVKKPIMTEDERRIRDVLAKKRLKGLDWEEMNLDQAVAYLRTITGLNFYISPKVREEKFDDVMINAQLDDVSVEAVLSAVLTEPFELRWDVRDGVVWIYTPEAFAGTPSLRGKAAPGAKSDGKPLRSGPGSFGNTTTVSLSVSDQSLGDVIKMLQIQTGLNLMIDPRIPADVAKTRITALKLENAPLATALTMLAASAGDDCAWTRQGNVQVLTRKEFLRRFPRKWEFTAPRSRAASRRTAAGRPARAPTVGRHG